MTRFEKLYNSNDNIVHAFFREAGCEDILKIECNNQERFPSGKIKDGFKLESKMHFFIVEIGGMFFSINFDHDLNFQFFMPMLVKHENTKRFFALYHYKTNELNIPTEKFLLNISTFREELSHLMQLRDVFEWREKRFAELGRCTYCGELGDPDCSTCGEYK